MNKLGFILLIVVFVIIVVVYKRSKSCLVTIAPQQCVFYVYENWSTQFQESIISATKQFYTSTRDADVVIEKVIQDFPEIGSIQAQVCSSDKICFFIEGINPVFLFNNKYVVNGNGMLSAQNSFLDSVQDELPKVFSDNNNDVAKMVFFVQQIPPAVTQSHDITWISNHEVIMQPRDRNDVCCITTNKNIPQWDDMQRCYALHDAHKQTMPRKKSKQSVVMEYDLRFKNQIIVRTRG